MKGLMPAEDGGWWLLIDKPSGRTSFGIVAVVRRITGIRKIGHAGALDPDATGLLVLALGRATKQLGKPLSGYKAYETTVQLGLCSPTLDLDAPWTIEIEPPLFEEDDIRQALRRIREKGEQVPPMVSSLKREGRKLHELARKGLWLAREPRPVEIERLDLLRYDTDTGEVELAVAGGGGLYVRVIAEDLGGELGLPAALTRLRRTQVGDWSIEDATDLETAAREWPEGTA
ncbi:tRNA pseudouridine(55) synthase TruB [bacterium]|nr:tRNA pseudouridine(55) synthase TruB [bacterium]